MSLLPYCFSKAAHRASILAGEIMRVGAFVAFVGMKTPFVHQIAAAQLQELFHPIETNLHRRRPQARAPAGSAARSAATPGANRIDVLLRPFHLFQIRLVDELVIFARAP